MRHSSPELFAPENVQDFDGQLPLGRRLLEAGVLRPSQLFEALACQRRWDASLPTILEAKGWVSGKEMLPFLSQHYSAPIVDLNKAPPDFRLLGTLSPQFCLKHSILPWIRLNGQTHYATSRPEKFETLKRRLPNQGRDARLALATEHQLQSFVAQHFQNRLVLACERRVAAHESCRHWAHQQNHRLIGGVLAATGIFIVSLVNFNAVLMALAFLILATQGLSATMKSMAFFASQRPKPTRSPPQDKPEVTPRLLPHISVLIPLYKETRIASALLKRLSALTYPRALLDVVLVLEAKDHLTKRALNNRRLPSWVRIVEVPAGSGLTTKPRAMNYALDFCRGEIIGIWDAEDAPAPDQLETVADHFANAPADVACVQGVLDYYNPRTNWISRCFTLEYSMWFRVIIRGMSRLGAAVPLGGTTLFLRRDAIETVGGWDAHNVTEDADLGIRLYRHGFKTDLVATVTQEEANCRFPAWVKQRSRWLKGYMVTYLVHMRRPRRLLSELGWRRFLGFNAIFLSTLSQFLLAPFVWSFWLLALGVSVTWVDALPRPLITGVAILFVAITVMDMCLAAISLRGQNRKWLVGWSLTLPVYFTLATLGAYKALYELVVAPFYWDKTDHGVTPEGTKAVFSAFSAKF